VSEDQGQRCRWYVVHAKPKQEQRADENLRAWGLETLAPRLRELRLARAARTPVVSVTPLFPGYLFAWFNPVTHLAKVRLTRGVHSVIGFGECATPVDDSLMDMIRSRIQPDGYVHPAEPRPGDPIEIIAGPLRSLHGVFEHHLNGEERVAILLTNIQAAARVQVPRTFIRPLRSHSFV
jgi:transcriptional antiterminator RfaH